MPRKKKSDKVSLDSLDFLLKDILEQIKFIQQEQKDAPYTKLIELFFKGVDLKEKISGVIQSPITPTINIIKGLDDEMI